MKFYTLFLLLFCFSATAQEYKAGDTVEIEVLIDSTNSRGWVAAEITEASPLKRAYQVKTTTGKTFVIPFLNHERWLRKKVVTVPSRDHQPIPTHKPATITATKPDEPTRPTPKKQLAPCTLKEAEAKQKLRQDLYNEHPDFDNIMISYVTVKEALGFTTRQTADTAVFAAEYYADITTTRNNLRQRKRWLYKQVYISAHTATGCQVQLLKSEKQELPAEEHMKQ